VDFGLYASQFDKLRVPVCEYNSGIVRRFWRRFLINRL